MVLFYSDVCLTGEDLSLTQLSDVTQIVLSVINLTDRMDEDMKDPSILLLSETQQRYSNAYDIFIPIHLSKNVHTHLY